MRRLFPARPAVVLLAAALLAALPARSQPVADLPGVTVTGRRAEPQVEKSYRRMVRGMDLFEARRAALAPQAELRFALLPRRPGVDLQRGLDLYVVGRSVEIPLDVGPDRRFALPRDARAWAEDARVSPARRAGSLSWRADVRTPGLPPGTRRLGDLRLECLVGMEAGLVSENPSAITRFVNQLADGPSYCDRPDNRYLYFAERPIFGVTLVDGARRASLPTGRLWAAALGDAGLPRDLAVCDCELLLAHAYFAPLADARWSDDTLLVFEFMPTGPGDAPR